MSCLPFGRHCSRSAERGCHVACALIGTNCATASRNWGCNVATRSAVAPRNSSQLILGVQHLSHHKMLQQRHKLVYSL